MQTKLSDFVRGNLKRETLPFTDDCNADTILRKRGRDTDYKSVYPLRSAESRSVKRSLQLLDFRLCNRYYARFTHAARAPRLSAFAGMAPPIVVQVSSSLHASRTNEDGEDLISSVEVFKNCITDIAWDPKDEFIIAARRSRFQLYGTSALLVNRREDEDATPPLLDLKATTVQSRLGAENRLSFGFSTTRFLGNTLSAICGYSGAAKIDVFDLEDLDEDTGEPLCSFDLSTLFPVDSRTAANAAPAATALESLSDTLAVAALSNGCSAFVDTRVAKPMVCTRRPDHPDCINAFGAHAGAMQRRRCNTAVGMLNSGCETQIVTGTKCGRVELWDLRRCDQPVATMSVGGAVETLHCAPSPNTTRCGTPLIWLNTEYGTISCLSVGATSLKEVKCVKTKDTRRSESSASLPPPKLSIMAQNSLLLYPYVSSNTLLAYDVEEKNGICVADEDENSVIQIAQRDSLLVESGVASGSLKNAKAPLQEEGTHQDDSALSLLKLDAMQRSPMLLRSLLFDDWSHQISCVSAAQRHDAVAVGGDDGDIHLLIDYPF